MKEKGSGNDGLLAFGEITTDLNPGSPSFWGNSGEFLTSLTLLSFLVGK